MIRKRYRGGVVGVAAAALLVASASRAVATEYFDGQRGEIQARVSTQNTFQANNAKSIDWVQWRNELRFDLKYQMIPTGQDYGPLALANFNMLWRGRMDPVYKLRAAYRDRNYDRENFIWPEGNKPRELFIDLGFNGALRPLSVRIGRQQVVWGEADLFRSIDVVNPLRIDQSGFVGEDFADLREPLWIAKFLWQIGSLGPISEAGLEFFYSPNSRPQADRGNILYGETWKIHGNQHAVTGTFDRNLVLPFKQVRHPWEFGRVGARYRDSPAVVQNADGTFSDFYYQINNDTSGAEIDFKDNSMAGVRLIGSTYGQIYFTLNYLFKRSDGAGSSVLFAEIFDPSAPGTGAVQPDVLARAVGAVGTPDLNGNGIPDGVEQQMRDCINRKGPELMLASIYSDPAHPELHTGANNVSYTPVLPIADPNVESTGCLGIPVWHPWTHIIGATATYNDYNITGLIFRLEQSFSTKEARTAATPQSPLRLGRQRDGGELGVPQERDFATNAMRVTQVWRSMIGFDYLKSIAPQSARTLPQPFRSFLSDQWFLTFQFLNEYYAHSDNVVTQTSFTNRMHHWNPLLTLAATGYFMSQRLRPTMAAAVDLSEKPFPLFIAQAEYFIMPKVALRVGEILYAGSKNNETNSGLHFYADRDTTFVRLTWFFI